MKDGKQQSLMTLLTESLTNYVLAKSGSISLELLYAKRKDDKEIRHVLIDTYTTQKGYRSECLRYITYAQNNGFFEETETVTSKLQKIEHENEQLKIRISNLIELNNKLAKDKQEALNALEALGGRKISDIEPK